MRALILLLAISLPGRAFDCPPEQRIKLDLNRWKASLKAAAPGSPEQRGAIRALGFPDVPSGSDEIPAGPCALKPVLKSVDLLDSKLTPAGDKTVQARFEMCGSAGARGPDGDLRFTSIRIAVVVPLGNGELCKLRDDDLSKDQAAWDSPCMMKPAPGRFPRTVTFVKLTSPAQNVLEIRDQAGTCKGSGREGSTRMALYEAHSASLDRIFQNKLWEISYDAQTPPAEETVWKLAYGKTLPKTIDVTRETRCLLDPRHLCTPHAETQKYVYAPPPVSAYVRAQDMQ